MPRPINMHRANDNININITRHVINHVHMSLREKTVKQWTHPKYTHRSKVPLMHSRQRAPRENSYRRQWRPIWAHNVARISWGMTYARLICLVQWIWLQRVQCGHGGVSGILPGDFERNCVILLITRADLLISESYEELAYCIQLC